MHPLAGYGPRKISDASSRSSAVMKTSAPDDDQSVSDGRATARNEAKPARVRRSG